MTLTHYASPPLKGRTDRFTKAAAAKSVNIKG